MKKLLKNQRKEYDKLFNELNIDVLQSSPDEFDNTMRIVSSRLITLCNDLKAHGADTVGHGEESANSRAELNNNADNLYEEIFKKFEVLAQEKFQNPDTTLADYYTSRDELRTQYRQYRDEHNIDQKSLVETAKELEETQPTSEEPNPQNDATNWNEQQLLDAGWTQEQIDQSRN